MMVRSLPLESRETLFRDISGTFATHCDLAHDVTDTECYAHDVTDTECYAQSGSAYRHCFCNFQISICKKLDKISKCKNCCI